MHPSALDKSHSAVRVRRPRERRGRVVRVVWNGDDAICFGDEELAGFADRERVFVDVATADHALLDEFPARVRVLDPAWVPDDVLTELVDHVSLGSTPEEETEALARLRRRRLVALEPS